jgi:hypothetical protein
MALRHSGSGAGGSRGIPAKTGVQARGSLSITTKNTLLYINTLSFRDISVANERDGARRSICAPGSGSRTTRRRSWHDGLAL